MDKLLVCLGGIVAFACAFVLSGGGRAASSPLGRSLHVRRLVGGALAWLSERAPVSRLDGIPAWHNLGEEAARRVLTATDPAGDGSLPRKASGMVAGGNLRAGNFAREGIALLLLADVLLAALLCLVSSSPLGIPAALGTALAGVPLLESSRQRGRKREISQEMPGVFRTLAMAVGSGETLAQAIEYLGSHETGLVGRPFARASLRLRCGQSAEEALGGLSRELDAPGVGLLTTALLISQRTGSPLRSLFQRAATLVERQGEFERMLEVKTAQVRLSVRIVCGLPVVMIAALSLLSPDFRAGLATLPGVLSVGVACAMDSVALIIIRRLMKGVV